MSAGFEKSPSTVLHCFLYHCDILDVCLIPQKSESRMLAYLRALYLKLFSLPSTDLLGKLP